MSPDRKSEQLEQLLLTGRTRGYVLYEEIDRILAGPEVLAELDTILSELTMNSVEVIDEPRTEDSIPDENAFDQEESQNPALPSIKLYLRELASVPRLSLEDEQELAKRVRRVIGELAGPRVSAKDEKGRIYYGATEHGPSPAVRDAEEAEKRLIEANLWIALATATHYRNRGLRLLELVQEGNIGLMQAVREYNYLRPYRFSTYAIWWVRKAIVRSIEDSR